jgi:hypothetical protein
MLGKQQGHAEKENPISLRKTSTSVVIDFTFLYMKDFWGVPGIKATPLA